MTRSDLLEFLARHALAWKPPRSPSCGATSSRTRATRPGAGRPRAERGARGRDRRLSCVQLDSISTVDRSHRIVLSSRVGRLSDGRRSRACSARAQIFEYWAHEACLIPVEDWPLFRAGCASGTIHHWCGPDHRRRPGAGRRTCSARSASAARSPRAHFEGQGGGGMWNWKPAKRMLEAPLDRGPARDRRAARASSASTTCPSACIPQALLDAPAPSEDEWLRGLALRAVRAPRRAHRVRDRRALPASRAASARLRPHVDALVADGQLRAARGRRRRRARARPRRRRARRPSRAAPSSSRRSTTCCGTATSRGASSASTT